MKLRKLLAFAGTAISMMAAGGEPSPLAEIRHKIKDLSANDMETREKGRNALESVLRPVIAGPDNDLRISVKTLLEETSRSAEPEVAKSISEWLAAIGVVWQKKVGDLPGEVSLFQWQGSRLAAGGAGPQGGWLGVYDVASGRTLMEKKGGELPGVVTHLLLQGDTLSVAGLANRTEKMGDMDFTRMIPWLGIYHFPDGKTVLETKPGELPGDQVADLRMQGDQVVARGGWRRPRNGRDPEAAREEAQKKLKDSLETAIPKDANNPGAWDLNGILQKSMEIVGSIGDSEGWLRSYDAATGKILVEKKIGDFPGDVACLRMQGERMAAGGVDARAKGWLGVYDAGSGKAVFEKKGAQLPGVVEDIQLHGGRVVVTGDTLGVHGAASNGQSWGEQTAWFGIYDAADGKTVLEKKGSDLSGPAGLQLWDRRLVVVTPEGDVYEATDGKREAAKKPGFPGVPLCFRYQGGRMAAGGLDTQGQGWAGLYDAASGKALVEKKAGEVPGRPFMLQLQGPYLAAAGNVPGPRGARGQGQGWICCWRLPEDLIKNDGEGK